MSVGNYLNLRIGRTSLLDNLSGFERFWNRDNQNALSSFISPSRAVLRSARIIRFGEFVLNAP
jgi:hypothetical protein